MPEIQRKSDALMQGMPVRFGAHEYVMSGGAESLAPAATFVDLRSCDHVESAEAVRTVEAVLSDRDGEYVIFRRPGVGRDSTRRADCVAVVRAG